MKNIFFISLSLILFVSCGKVKIGQMEKKGSSPEGNINQPQRDGGPISGGTLESAKRICNMLNQKDFNFKQNYKGKTFSFAVTYKDCGNNNFNTTPSGMLDLEGSSLVYVSGAGPEFYKYEDSASSANFKTFCDGLLTSPTDVVLLNPNKRLLYTIAANNVTIDEGDKDLNGRFISKFITSYELVGSGPFVGMITSLARAGACPNSSTVRFFQNQSVTSTP